MSGKRLFDVLVASVGGCLVLPVIATLAAVTWLCDGRPIFFGQERVGREGRVFRIWKLRTMTREPEPKDRCATRWGRWMRDRGLDELPQVFNVLVGDMSCVGPRPLTPADLTRLVALHPPFARRHAARPGITGLAQVCGARGVELCARVEAEYVRQQGLGLDLSILSRTAWIHLVGKRRGMRPLPPSCLGAGERGDALEPHRCPLSSEADHAACDR